MTTLLVLVGVRGAGKTTVQDRLRESTHITVLKPSTTRARRGRNDTEYHFYTGALPAAEHAWTIEYGGASYGLKQSEIASVSEGCVGVTVFEPSNIATLEEYRRKRRCEVVTVGLDTIDTWDEQRRRVNRDATRIVSREAFDAQRRVVCDCDLVLRGDVEVVYKAIHTAATILLNRGTLEDNSIRCLLEAGALLTHADSGQVQPASYDLRLDDELWMDGKIVRLSEQMPLLEIPPYSFAIVSSREKAALPRFVTGNYDLKVSMFMEGLILSNGPQVDPGYIGALFCLLFNASDRAYPMKRGHPFATLEFNTTTQRSAGYGEKHQRQQSLADFMDGRALGGPGSRLLERYTTLEKKAADFEGRFRPYLIALVAGALAVIGFLAAGLYANLSATGSLKESISAATKALDHARERARDLEAQLAEANRQVIGIREEISRQQGRNGATSPTSVPASGLVPARAPTQSPSSVNAVGQGSHP